jgi:hypothetical protein
MCVKCVETLLIRMSVSALICTVQYCTVSYIILVLRNTCKLNEIPLGAHFIYLNSVSYWPEDGLR